MAAARTVFIDTALSNYQSLAAQYDPAIFDIVLLDNTSPYSGQIQSWMTANGASPADINIVSASASVNGAFTPRVVFVDAGVADLETVIAGVPANATVVVLDPARDGIQQIRDYLAANAGQVGAIDIVTDLASVDVVSHGAPGEITLGSTVLNADNLASYSSQLAAIGSHLSAGGDILLYGCDVASGTAGQQFITALASATGADVAASTDLTGSAAAGGDWTLEASTGTIETAALDIAGYEGLLGNVQSLSKIALSSDTGSSNSDFITATAVQTIALTGTINDNGTTRVWVTLDGSITGRTQMDVTTTGTGSNKVYSIGPVTLLAGAGNSIKIWDGAGQNANLLYTQAYTLDNTLPAAGSLGFSGLSDTGASSTDGITSDRDFSLTVTGNEAGSSVVYEVSTDNGATFTATTALQANLPDRSYQFRAIVTDAAGNSSTTAVAKLTIDSAAPAAGSLSFSGLTDSGVGGDGVTNDRTFSLSLSGNEAGSSVVYRVSTDGGATYRDTTASQTSLADGSYKFVAVVSDAAGNSSTTSPISVTIDATAPGAPSITAFSDNSGSTADTLTKDTTPTLIISAEADSRVEVFRNGVSVGTATQTATKGVYTFTSAVLADGSYGFTAQATDAAGNASIASSVQNVTVDTTAPIPTLSLTTDSGAAGDKLTNDASLTFGALETGATRIIKVDGGVVGAYNAGALADGSHTVEITDTDAADNSATASLTFTLDQTPPAPGTLGFVDLLDSGDSSDGLTNDRDFSLALTGNEVGSSVRYEVSVNGGAFTTTSTTQAGLTDGSYTYRAIVSDAAGNESTSSTASVSVDATAPGAPNITAFSDNSGSTGDNLTKDTTPTVTISAEADSKVEVFRNGVSVGTATQTTTKGIYTFTSALLTDGSYNFTAQSTDAAGNTGTVSSAQNITIDATAPTPTLSLATDSGAAGDKLTNDASLTFGALETGATRVIKVDGSVVGSYNGGALADGSHTVEIADTDAADNSATASLTFTVDKTPPTPGALGFANLLDSGDSSDGLTNDRDFDLALTGNEGSSSVIYEVSVNGGAFVSTTAAQAALTDGSYQFRAIVSDAAGNESTSSTASVTIDATAPNAPSITAFSDNSGSTADTLTKDTTPTLTISAEADSNVEVFRNGVLVGTATQTAVKGVYTFTSAVLADSSYDFSAKATDAAGNASIASATQNITIDATAPTPTLSLATDSGAAGDKLTNDANLTFDALETGATRVIKVDNAIVGAYDANALADGSHTVEITDTDAADNSATASLTFTVDKTPPTPGALGFANLLDSGDSSDDLTNDRDFDLALTGNEAGSSVRYEVSVNGGAFVSTNAVQAALANGSYTFRAIVNDAAGNESTSSTASVTIDATAPNAPSITGFSDNSGSTTDTLTKDTTPTLTISAEADSNVEVFRNGVLVGTATQSATKGVYTFTSAVLADGSYDFRAQSTDAAGNASIASSAQNITIDATAPTPTLSLTTDSGAAGDKLTNDARLTFGALETGATRVIKVDGGVVGAYNVGALADGSHTVEITDTDAADNSATATLTFTVDKTAPAPGTLGFANLLDSGDSSDSLTNDRDFSLVLTGNEVSSSVRYEVSVNGGAFVSTTAAQAALADGSYTFRAIVSDAAGNESTSSTASVSIDATAPDAPSITAFSDNSGSTADTLTKDTTPTLTISAEADSKVEVFRNGVAVGTATQTATKGIYTFTSAILADGSYDFKAQSTDAAGNASIASATQNITIDATAPTPTLSLTTDSGAAGDKLTNDARLTFGALETGATRVIKVDNAIVGAYDAGALADGSHTVEVTDTDAADNSATTTFTFTLDRSGPLFSSGAKASVAENIGENQLVYKAAAADPHGVSYSLAGVDAAKFAIAADGSVTLKENPNSEGVKAYGFTVVATDSAGNHTDQAVALSITNVNEAPIAKLVPLSTIENAPISFAVLDAADDPDAGDKFTLALVTGTAKLASADGKPLMLINPVTKAAIAVDTLSVKASLSADGTTVLITPPEELDWMMTGQAVKASLEYSVTDAGGLSARDTISLTITGSTNDKGLNINGGNGADTLSGNTSNNAEDVLMGGNGDDIISGYGGTDALYGGNGDDRLSGGAGIDYLYGDSGNDTLDGGLDGDYLFGGKGNDLLTGGAGADKFVFSPQNGNDRITDFKLSEGDKLFFADFFSSGMTVDSFLAKYVTDTGNDLQINLQGTTITLVGVANVSDLAGVINFGMPV